MIYQSHRHFEWDVKSVWSIRHSHAHNCFHGWKTFSHRCSNLLPTVTYRLLGPHAGKAFSLKLLISGGKGTLLGGKTNNEMTLQILYLVLKEDWFSYQSPNFLPPIWGSFATLFLIWLRSYALGNCNYASSCSKMTRQCWNRSAITSGSETGEPGEVECCV